MANGDNWKTLIEDKIQVLSDKFDTSKQWANNEHEEMKANVEKKFAELTQVTNELRETLATTNGYLKRLAEEK